MHPYPAPQELRTFFVTFVTAGRKSLFQVERNSVLLMEVFQSDRLQGRYELHAWVAMPDHVHLLITPKSSVSLEKAIQYIKGGFSFRLRSAHQVWERSFREHRIQDAADFGRHRVYIEENPVRAKLAASSCRYAWRGTFYPSSVDAVPKWFSVNARG